MEMKNTTSCFLAAPTQRVTREQISESRLRLEQEFLQLIHAEAPLLWKGSVTDLMELVYLVYVNGNFRDADGYPLSMVELTRRACTALCMPVPDNPYALAARAMNRKGLKRQPLLDRYAWLYCVAGIEHPLERIIKHVGTAERREA